MEQLLIAIGVIFIIGYALIALEHRIGVNKSATALFLGMVLWALYLVNAGQFVPVLNAEAFTDYLAQNPNMEKLSLLKQTQNFIISNSLVEHVGDVAEILFFLMGAMTIVEIIDSHGGFGFVSKYIKVGSKRKLLWQVSLITFFLSAVLDNMTTAIVMIMILRKLMARSDDRLIFASMVILAANAGGAFSPIGDVTTIMLWINGNISTFATIGDLFLPSLTSMIVPLIIFTFRMKGQVKPVEYAQNEENLTAYITRSEKVIIFVLGVGGLMSVPVLRELTGLPPFLGIISVLSVLWIYTEFMYEHKRNMEQSVQCRVSKIIKHIDMPTIFFFFGILMAVAALQEVGILGSMAATLNKGFNNVYAINTIIGLCSSVVDNVPLVAGAMGMYSVAQGAVEAGSYVSHFMVDGAFWQLLAYCAGVGGSILIIGSAAGVVVMGLEKINFAWYLKRISWVALIGYFAGIGVYALQSMLW